MLGALREILPFSVYILFYHINYGVIQRFLALRKAITTHGNRGYYVAARGYEFYLRALKRYFRENKIRIPKRPCKVLFILDTGEIPT